MDSQETNRRKEALDRLGHALLDPPKEIARELRKATGWWWLPVLFGLVSIALGVTALASRVDALGTLVAVFGVYLVYAGLAELAFASTTRRNRLVGIVAGVASIAAAFIALAWPSVTLFVLAALMGASLISWGIYRIYLSFTDPFVTPRAIALIEGVVLVALGVLALAWPNVSVLVLAVLVGLFFIVFGVFSFVSGLQMLDLHRALKKAEADHD